MKKLFKYVISTLERRQDNRVGQLDLADYVTERRMFIPTHEQVALIRRHGMHSKPRQRPDVCLHR